MLNTQLKEVTSSPNILYVTQLPNQGQNLVKVINLIPLGSTPNAAVAKPQIVNTKPTSTNPVITVLNKPTAIAPQIVRLPNIQPRPVIKLTRVAPKIINLCPNRPPAPQAIVNNLPTNNHTVINQIPNNVQQQQPVFNHFVPQSQSLPTTANSLDSLTFLNDELPNEIHPKQFFEPINATSSSRVNNFEKPLQIQTDLNSFAVPTNEQFVSMPQHQVVAQQPTVNMTNESSYFNQQMQQYQPQYKAQKQTITTLLAQAKSQQISNKKIQQQEQSTQQPQPPQQVKRPLNPFILWSQQERRKINDMNSLTSSAAERLGDISRQLGLKWGLMSQEEKLPYILEAERLKQAHKVQYPDYKLHRQTTHRSSKRSRRSVESSSVGTSSSNTTLSDYYSQPQPSPYSVISTSTEHENSSVDNMDDLDISNIDFDSADFESLISSFDMNQPIGSDSTICSSNPITIDLTGNENEVNQCLNSDSTLIKHNMLDGSSVAMTPPNDLINVDNGRKKQMRDRKPQSRRLSVFVTSLGLVQFYGEKKLKQGHNQTTRVITINGDNAELKKIAESLINKGSVRPGENLLCSIDPATLSALLAHVNRLNPSTTSIQSNYDDLDITYDWEIDRSKLETASAMPSNSNESSTPLIPSSLTDLSQLAQPVQSEYSFDLLPNYVPSSSSTTPDLNTNDLLLTDDEFKSLFDSPNIFDDDPIIY